MSKATQTDSLVDFLLENPVDNLTSEIIVSKRLEKFPFTIKAMSGKDQMEYSRQATVVNKGSQANLNPAKFNELMIIRHTINPDFRNAENMKKSGCTRPEEYLYKVLNAGEISKLVEKITELSGFDQDIDELAGEVKND